MGLRKANQINFNDFHVLEPFPEIKDTKLSEDLIYEIKRGYAGKESELTSVTQYVYQYFILFKSELTDNIGKSMQLISSDESRHFEILAKKLSYTDVDPKFCRFIDNNPEICEYWCGYNIDYVKEIKDMMISNKELEEGAIIAYNEIIKTTDDPNLIEIATRILKDEHSHMDYFNAVLKALEDDD